MPRTLEEKRRYERERYARWKAENSEQLQKHKLRSKQHYLLNREIHDARTKQFFMDNPEKAKEYRTRHRSKEDVKLREREYNLKYKAANREKQKQWELNRQIRLKSDPELLERRRDRGRLYYQRNAEARKQAVRRYGAAHPEKRSLYVRISASRRRVNLAANGGTCTTQQWIWRFHFYGGRCAYCGIHLTITEAHKEHVMPVSKGGTDWPSNLVPACPTCNYRKHQKCWTPKRFVGV